MPFNFVCLRSQALARRDHKHFTARDFMPQIVDRRKVINRVVLVIIV
jgi:hypothetical protein